MAKRLPTVTFLPLIQYHAPPKEGGMLCISKRQRVLALPSSLPNRDGTVLFNSSTSQLRMLQVHQLANRQFGPFQMGTTAEQADPGRRLAIHLAELQICCREHLFVAGFILGLGHSMGHRG